MRDAETERARAVAQDLIRVLSDYEDELSAMAGELPAIEPLRAALGAALAQAVVWVSDRDAGDGVVSRTTH